MHELIAAHPDAHLFEPNSQSSPLEITEAQRTAYQAELTKAYVDRSINSVDVRVINSIDDLEAQVLILRAAGRIARSGRVMVFMIAPDTDLLKSAYEMLGDDVKEATPIPQGIARLVEDEKHHVEAATLIKEGRGIANSLGIPNTFLFCFRILVYPEFRAGEPEDVFTRLNISTLVNHEPTTTFDQRLAMNLEIILGSLNRLDDVIPQSDRVQLIQILRWSSERTPLLNRVIQELLSLIPPELQAEISVPQPRDESFL